MTEIIDKQMNRKKGRVAEKLIGRQTYSTRQTKSWTDRLRQTWAVEQRLMYRERERKK